MSTISIQQFRNIIATAQRGYVDIDSHGNLELKKFCRFHPTVNSGTVRNQKVRQSFLEALTSDGKLGNDYITHLSDRVIRTDGALTVDELRTLLDNYDANVRSVETFKGAIKFKSSSSVLKGDVTNFSDLALRAGEKAAAVFDVKSLGKLFANCGLTHDALQQLMKHAAAAEKALTKFYAFKGSDFLSPKGRDAMEKCVKTVGDELMNLDGALRKIINHMDDPPEGLYRLSSYCASRTSELTAFYMAAKEGVVPANKKVSVLMAEFAASMHTNDDVLRIVSDKSSDLKNRLDALKNAKPGAMQRETDIQTFRNEVNAFRDVVSTLADKGVAFDGDARGGVFKPDLTFTDGVMTELDAVLADLDELLNKNHTALLKSLVAGLFPDRFEDPEKPVSPDCQLLALATRETLMEAVSGGVDAIDFDAFARAKEALKGHAANTPLGCNPSAIDHFEMRVREFVARAKHGVSVDAALLKKLFDNRIGVGTAVGAYLHGLDGDSVDDRFDDRFLVETKPLGHGQVNSVFLVTHQKPGGEPFVSVFKPEENAKFGMYDVMIGQEGYGKSSRIADLNVSTSRVAHVLGVESTAVDVSIGVHKGQIGFFMGLAPGDSGQEIADRHLIYGESEVQNLKFDLPKATDEKLVKRRRSYASLMREFCKLEWLDWATGQMDRHRNNYKIEQKKDGSFAVRGIDNDGSFSYVRMGLCKFRLVGNHLQKTLEALHLNDVNELERRYPDRVSNAQNGDLILDAEGDPALLIKICQHAIGVNNVVRPKRIPHSVYESLMNLDERARKDPNALLDEAEKWVGPCRSTAEAEVAAYRRQVEATASRMREMIEYAKVLAKKEEHGLGVGDRDIKYILDDDDWTQEASNVVDEGLAEQDRVGKQYDSVAETNNAGDRYDVVKLMSDYFTRDFAELLCVD